MENRLNTSLSSWQILNGKSSFKWIEGGAFLIWYSEIDEAHFPGSVAIFGSDDATEAFFMLYFDERKVSRKYEVSFQDNVLKWWRNAPGFSQRYIWTFTEGGNTIMGKESWAQMARFWKGI